MKNKHLKVRKSHTLKNGDTNYTFDKLSKQTYKGLLAMALEDNTITLKELARQKHLKNKKLEDLIVAAQIVKIITKLVENE